MNEQLLEERKHERHFLIFTVLIFILIIILFFINMSLGYIEHKPRIPTGNIDIFDIYFNNDCCNCNCPNCPINPEVPNDTNQSTPSISENSPENIEVFDRETSYSQNTPLNIFTKTSYYVVNDKIAPASENSYQFVIRNHNDFNIKYDLELSQTNIYNINMKYRLKLNGVYVAGSDDTWLTYEELNQYNIGLQANNYDVYTLDWRWFESSNDTQIGTNINSYYKLNLKITASSY